MILEHIDISGFRGINQLSLPLTQTNILIGENAWGKSSLLDALSLLLSPLETPYSFTPQDFHFTPGNSDVPVRRLLVVFRFRAEGNEQDALFEPFWQRDDSGQRWLHVSYRGRLRDSGVTTSRRFVSQRGDVLPEAGSDAAIDQLTRLHPVLRLRDARFAQRMRQTETHRGGQRSVLDKLTTEVTGLIGDVGARPQNLSDEKLREALVTLQQLMEHYFLVQHPASRSAQRADPTMRDGMQGWRSLDRLNQLIGNADSRSRQIMLLRLFSLLVQARGSLPLMEHARPMLLLEDPETRLHPIMLSVTWDLLELLPLQKMATTNSAELLSRAPVESVCRLVREQTRVKAWRIGPEGLSAEESRRIGFHIRVNRPSALFARCWLLVEGETEVWIINELARQSGCHFDAEGVKVIEFAQCGLKPLLKFARRMGIAWHVLTDGDQAGQKYAATVRSQLQPQDPPQHYLTMLPAADIENFLFAQGFADVYTRAAHLPLNIPMSARRIITKAIHRASKPELAVAVAMAVGQRGPQAIPLLMRQMFSRVMWLARGKAD